MSVKHIYVTDMSCCGVKEINGISCIETGIKPASVVSEVKEMFASSVYHKYSAAFIIFTQAGHNATYGDELAEFITKNKLGTVTESPSAINPNSDNPVIVFVWKLNHGALAKFHEKKPKSKVVRKKSRRN